MSSLLDVAKAMNAEAASNTTKLCLLDVAQDEDATSSMSLMDVAKKETITSEVPKKTLRQLAQDIDNEDRSRIQVALESTAKEVKVERQELRTQIIRQTADVVQQEEVQAAQVLREKVAAVDSSNPKVEQNEEDDEADGYSSFEDDDDSLPKRENKNKKEEKAQDDDPTEEEENYEPPPRTTPSESKESKEFLRAVYRADKYQVRDMLNGKIVDANIADQHGWSGLHWAASQNHSDILSLLLQGGAEINAIDQINGWTALHVAVVRESVSCLTLLLSSGADPRIRDNYGDNAADCLHAASKKKKLRMLQLLQEARCNNSR